MASIKKKAAYRLFKLAHDMRALKVMGNSENDNAILEEMARRVEALQSMTEGMDAKPGPKPKTEFF
jgi:hypothetical protein